MSEAFAKSLTEWIDDPALSSELVVSGVCQDSRLCEKGDAYLALGGAMTHGYHFAQDAVNKGAVVVLVSPDIANEHESITNELQQQQVLVVQIEKLDELASTLAARFYDFPSESLTIVAITGTDGKTSVCQFIKEALTQVGSPCGYIGTLGWGVNDSHGVTALTTPDAVALQRMLATMRRAGAKAVAMEASSHGIAEGRLNDVAIDIAVLTNLGRDHLDYHVSEEAYREAKSALFRWPSLKAIVVNGDDELGRSLRDVASKEALLDVHVYSCSSMKTTGDAVRNSAANDQIYNYVAKNVTLNKAGLNFELVDGDSTYEIFSSLYGRFNVENMSACYAVLRALGVSANDGSDALQLLARVPGRMEPFNEFAQPTVIVDYAHTPQALSAAVDAVREHARGQVWVVFGCGGDRDPGKRALMGKAAEAADHIVVTDDNPRNENPSHIRLMIINGLDKPTAALEIGNRERAIQYAIWHAQPDDAVLVAGKGHEGYQIVGDQVLEFSDREAVQRMLKEAC